MPSISVNQQAIYGDKKLLDETRTKTAPMSGAQVPAGTAGRPAGSSAEPTAPAAAVPQEHVTLIQALAQSDKTRQFWERVAAQYPSPTTELYREAANRDYQALAQKTRAATPFFA